MVGGGLWLPSAADHLPRGVATGYRQKIPILFCCSRKAEAIDAGHTANGGVVCLDEDAVLMGYDDTQKLVQDYETRRETENWQQPYSSGIVPLRLPRRRVYEGE